MPGFDFDEVKEEESIITPRRTPGESSWYILQLQLYIFVLDID